MSSWLKSELKSLFGSFGFKLFQKLLTLFKHIECCVICAFWVVVTSCGESKSKPVVKSFTEIGNYEYYHHIKNRGRVPQGGDTVVIHFCLRNGEKKVHCTQWRNSPISLNFPPPEANFKNPLPIFEGVRRMSAGDSLSIYYPITEGKIPNGFEDAEYVIYDIVVLDIKPFYKN